MSKKKINKIAEEKAFDYQRELGMIDSVSDDHVIARRMGFYDGFIDGAEWQKDKMMEEAVEANLLSVEGDSYGIVSYTFQGRRFPAAFSGKCFSYKIIVIKDEK